MWRIADLLLQVCGDCNPKLLESRNVLLYHETRTEVWDTYLQLLKDRAAVDQLVPQLYKLAKSSSSILYWLGRPFWLEVGL